jgi:lysine 6-dehydrogenase
MVTFPGDTDVVVIRILARGLKDGQGTEAVLELMDCYDEETGFTAMERTTGWDGAIVAGMMARAQTPRGAVPRELSLPAETYVQELDRRGIKLQTRVEFSVRE